MVDSIIGADLTSIFADTTLTLAVNIGNSSTRGMFDQQDIVVQDGFGKDAQVRSTVVTIKKGSLTGIVADAVIVVDGVSYKVREQALSDDGLLQHIKVA